MNSKSIGKLTVHCISDGTLPTSLAVLVGLHQKTLEELTGVSKDSSISLAVNNFLFSIDGKLVLVDAGAGATLGPGTGQLPTNLKAAGIAPEDIKIILLTHLHPDHSNGLIDGNGRAVFPGAEVYLHEEEATFWLDRGSEEGDPERIKRGRQAAHLALAPYSNRMRRVRDGEILPGVFARLLPGHTPGHTGWLLQSAGDRLLIWGDIVHLASVQVTHPEAALIFDFDQSQASRTRVELFGELVHDKLLVAGAHLPFPGFGFISKENDRFSYKPA